MHAKFEVRIFVRSGDIQGGPKSKPQTFVHSL